MPAHPSIGYQLLENKIDQRMQLDLALADIMLMRLWTEIKEMPYATSA